MSANVDLDKVNQLLHNWLSQHISESALEWLGNKQSEIANGAGEKCFFTAFSAVHRYIGKQNLQLTSQDLEIAKNLLSDWVPSHWRTDQVGRSLLLLALPNDNLEKYGRSLDQIFSNADMGELVVLYQSLPLLPYPEIHRKRAAEGIRSNMLVVFQAVALQNPYPANYLDDIAWNQMVLKAIFVDSPLDLIWGLDRRANPELAIMLINYVRERQAANRPVTAQLWQLVKPFINHRAIADLAIDLSWDSLSASN